MLDDGTVGPTLLGFRHGEIDDPLSIHAPCLDLCDALLHERQGLVDGQVGGPQLVQHRVDKVGAIPCARHVQTARAFKWGWLRLELHGSISAPSPSAVRLAMRWPDDSAPALYAPGDWRRDTRGAGERSAHLCMVAR